MRIVYILVVLLIVATGCVGHTADSHTAVPQEDTVAVPVQAPLSLEREALRLWTAGAIVSDSAIASYSLDSCFCAIPIPDSIFALMQGVSFVDNSPVARQQLRYLRILHRNGQGDNQLGEMVVNAQIADATLRIFRQLYSMVYPIESMKLVCRFGGDDIRSMQANNSSGFNARFMTGSASKWSRHAYGMAIDINPLYNPYVKGTIVKPQKGEPYAKNRHISNPYFVNDSVRLIFQQEGFRWGGAWRTMKDYQHFQK